MKQCLELKESQDSFKLHISGPSGCPAGAGQISAHSGEAIQETEAIFRMQAAAPAQMCLEAVQHGWKSFLNTLICKSLANI